ncbi:glycosyltransferase family 2 protein [Pikeienuella piscinae]|uniref:Glycosyltransferase family 2 protein n=1 Tax=Pikeienuella piscinae TaxID=2748098 RepID=A0A7L5C3A3_9RHOB|nr:glycosyltransferase family 2 protein [Pikeienuella piscinae]QIE56349.1 glycosyltransferase family 2 protein [Pikeienuella piscinae]
MADPILSIIVVSYNTREMTLECLRSVYAETRTPFELIVVDNDSPDGSAEAIGREFPDAMLIAEKINHGFARANNIAAKHARGEFILLLNPDTVVLDGALDRLLAFARARPEARIWGGRTVFGDRSLNPGSCWRRITLWNLFCRAIGAAALFPRSAVLNSEGYGGWDRMSERQVDIVTGCLFLLSRADWEALDGFDPIFFMYGEEADLCMRAAEKLGARPAVTPDAVIVHYHGQSSNVRADKIVRLLQAKREIVRRHFPTWQQPLAAALLALWPWTRSVAYRLIGRESAWVDVWRRRGEWKNGFS